MILGVTGSLGSGKSTVARFLAEKGAVVLDADEVVHRCLEPRGPAYERIRRLFGDSIVGNDGKINRRRLAQFVFANKERLKKLCGILHPKVLEEFRYRVEEILQRDPQATIVLDVPLLLETRVEREVDRVIVVTTTLENQIKRSSERLGLSQRESLQRIHAQQTLAEKSKQADFVLSTSGSLDETRKQVEELWKRLKI